MADSLKDELEDFVKGIERALLSPLAEEDRAYFEGKKFAYECVIEMIEKEKCTDEHSKRS